MNLQGRTILVTRPPHQADDLIRPLEALGATAIRMPAIEILPAEDLAPLDSALREIERYDWVVFTSVNGVEAVADRLDAPGRARLAGRKLAVIGSATATALAAAFRAPDFGPHEYVAEAIADGLGPIEGQRLLLARADRARPELPATLRARGAVVDDVVAYRIVRAVSDVDLPHETPDAITLTSSESARATLETLQRNGREAWFSASALVCIGPVTAETVRELGYAPAAVATSYTIPGLIEALNDYFAALGATHG